MSYNTNIMLAGPDMDRLVAERVMGWTELKWYPYEAACQNDDAEREGWFGIPPDCKYRERVDRREYSKSIAAAWEVVERMAKHYHRNLVMNHTGAQYRCRFLTLEGPRIWDWAQRPNDGLTAWDESAPLAICRAALAMMETP